MLSYNQRDLLCEPKNYEKANGRRIIMPLWEFKTVKEVVQGIRDNTFVLPVIQRDLVWNDDKMKDLFDSLLKDNSFGGIMVLNEEKETKPLFAFRRFSHDGEVQLSSISDKLNQSISLVIDGQQRFQTFYMGLEGSRYGKTMYFNLYSTKLEYEFRFAREESELPSEEIGDRGEPIKKLWYPVRDLFNRLRRVNDEDQVANEILESREIIQADLRENIKFNIRRFYRFVFIIQTIGIASVEVNMTRKEEEIKRIVELFRRLNDGGTRLSAFDLIASTFKAFDHRMEQFFKDVLQFKDMDITQDEIIKLIFLLQDEHTKDVTEIEQKDADFVIKNQERIIKSLEALRKFLQYAKLYDYYHIGDRSDIPLYFITYHIFHKSIPTDEIVRVYDNYDAKNDDYICLKKWMYLSNLNGVFSRGCGWIPYKTGIRKILNVIRNHKEGIFPTEELFNVYRNHPLKFFTDINVQYLDGWDRDFVFYMIYDFDSLPGRDNDHVQPKSILENENVSPEKIYSKANFQRLDLGTNRREKRAKTLKDWLKSDGVTDLQFYIERHLIPRDENLWDIINFDQFLDERSKLIVEKVNSFIPSSISTSHDSS